MSLFSRIQHLDGKPSTPPKPRKKRPSKKPVTPKAGALKGKSVRLAALAAPTRQPSPKALRAKRRVPLFQQVQKTPEL